MKTTVYLAAPWARRAVAKEVARRLEEAGFHIAHDWWNHDAPDIDVATLAIHARRDMNAVLSCDIFVLLNLEKSEGKAVETGLALCRPLRPRMIGVGKRGTNIFQHLGYWEWIEKPRDLVPYLCQK